MLGSFLVLACSIQRWDGGYFFLSLLFLFFLFIVDESLGSLRGESVRDTFRCGYKLESDHLHGLRLIGIMPASSTHKRGMLLSS